MALLLHESYLMSNSENCAFIPFFSPHFLDSCIFYSIFILLLCTVCPKNDEFSKFARIYSVFLTFIRLTVFTVQHYNEIMKKKSMERVDFMGFYGFEKRKMRRAEDTAPSFHRPAYHQEFESYTESVSYGSRGRKKICRIYTGKYYIPVCPGKETVFRNIFYLFGLSAGIFFFLLASLQQSYNNYVRYINLVQMFTVLLFLWMIYLVIFYIGCSSKMTHGEYRYLHEPLLLAPFLTAGLLWFCSIHGVIGSLFVQKQFASPDLLYFTGNLLAGLLLFFIGQTERKLIYQEVENSVSASSDGIVIRSEDQIF